MAVKKTVLLVSSEFPPQPGGIGNHALHLAKTLSAAGRELTVLTNSRGEWALETEFDKNLSFRVVRIKRRPIAWLTYGNRVLRFLIFLQQNRGSIVIASGRFSLWLSWLGKILFPRKFMLGIVHGSELAVFAGKNRLLKWLTRKSLAAFDQLVAVSHFTKNLVLQVLPQAKVTVVHNGFDPKKFTQVHQAARAQHPPRPTLLSVGSISRRKGQHHLLRALPLLRRAFPHVHYHVVGIATEAHTLEKLAKNLGVEAQVSIHGAMADGDVVALIQEASILVMLSENTPDGDVEGFGIAVLEANSAGLPALGAQGTGVDDAIREGYSGRLVNAADAQEILSALTDIWENYPRYSANAKCWSDEFTWEKKGKEYLDLLP